MPRRFRTNILQCVVLTTRPQIMCALHMHIEQATTQVSRGINLSPPVASLIQSCVDSAQTVLSTLRALADEDLLGKLSHSPHNMKSLTEMSSSRIFSTLPSRIRLFFRLSASSYHRYMPLPSPRPYLARRYQLHTRHHDLKRQLSGPSQKGRTKPTRTKAIFFHSS